MKKRSTGLLSLSLSVLVACTVQKGDDTDNISGSTDGTGDTTTTGSTGDSTTGDSSSGGSTSANPTSSTGNATGGQDGGSYCLDTPTVLAPGDATPLGVSAEQLLADKLGARATTLTFADEPLSLSDAWKGKQLPLTVELRYEGGEVRWIDSEPNPDWDDSGNDSGFPGECIDRLEIDVALDFVTEGGEFDEHPAATLSATTPDRAELLADLLPPGLAGSFDPAALYGDPEWMVNKVQVAGTWQGTLAGGSLLNEVKVGGDGGFVGYGGVASWGDAIDFP